MKYIVPDPNGGYDHTSYWQYLDSARTKMPTHIFEFASNTENHDLTSPNSLHDAWLESWSITELAAAEFRRQRSIRIDARLLGSRWDRYIHLCYKNVGRYELQNSQADHGDLLVHEMRVVRDDPFAHELLFAKGSTFLVEFSEFEYRIEIL